MAPAAARACPAKIGALPMSPRRKAIAKHMMQSWSEIPHVTTFDTANVRRLLDARTALTKRHDRPISIDALVIMAVLPPWRLSPR